MRMDPRTTLTNQFFIASAACMAAAMAALTGCTPTMSEQVTQSIGVLSNVQTGEHPVEGDVFRSARGVALIDETQWGLILGHSGGKGLLLRRLAAGGWSPPCAIKAGSLSLGLTAGGQGRDVVIVFDSDESVDAFVADGGYFLATAQGTFGDASSGTPEPVQKDAKVHAYTVSEGVWASVALGGMAFSIDRDVNEATYGPDISAWDILDGKVKAPVGQAALVARLERISKQGTATASGGAEMKTEATPPQEAAGARSTTERMIPVESTGSGQRPVVER